MPDVFFQRAFSLVRSTCDVSSARDLLRSFRLQSQMQFHINAPSASALCSRIMAADVAVATVCANAGSDVNGVVDALAHHGGLKDARIHDSMAAKKMGDPLSLLYIATRLVAAAEQPGRRNEEEEEGGGGDGGCCCAWHERVIAMCAALSPKPGVVAGYDIHLILCVWSHFFPELSSVEWRLSACKQQSHVCTVRPRIASPPQIEKQKTKQSN